MPAWPTPNDPKRAITHFYNMVPLRGVFLNVPDWYFLTGSTRPAWATARTNWSLPGEQETSRRQNIYDGT